MKYKINYFLSSKEIVEPISNHGNNKLFTIIADGKKYLLKRYNINEIERIKHETQFYEYLSKKNIFFTPRLIDFSYEKNFLITSFIESKKNILAVNPTLVYKYADFLNLLNSKNNFESYELSASESYNSQTHLENLIEKKIYLYKSNINEKQIKIKASIDFLENKFYQSKMNLSNCSISSSKKILSPSDVGFHNTLLSDDSLYFFDFEYSGVDDPLKLVSDFILQPRYYITKDQVSLFLNTLSFLDDNFIYNLNKIFPLFVIKWILIFYNFLDPKNEKKYEHFDLDKVINDRINKAKRYFKILEENYEIY